MDEELESIPPAENSIITINGRQVQLAERYEGQLAERGSDETYAIPERIRALVEKQLNA